MDNYIIDPSFFYWIDVISNLKNLIGIIACISFIVCVLFLIMGLLKITDWWREEEKKDGKRIIEKSFIAGIIGISIMAASSFIPSKDTLVKMQLAKFGTYDNVEKVVEVIDEKTDALIDAIAGHNKECDKDE